MISLGGGRALEVGSVNETLPEHIAGAITERTAAVMYVTSRTHAVHRRGVPLEDVVAIAHDHGVPVIVDAAAEEDLRHWPSTGADLVTYSGPKSIGAPTSGFICGRQYLIAACRAQYGGIARPMKVGKENLMGLLQAVREYQVTSPEERAQAQRLRMNALAERVGKLPGLRAEVVQNDAGRPIYRVVLTFDPLVTGRDAPTLAKQMATGTPAVFLRDFQMHLGQLEIDPRALTPAGEDEVVRRLEELLLARPHEGEIKGQCQAPEFA